MSFWDGTQWVSEAELQAAATCEAGKSARREARPRALTALMLVIGLMIVLPLQGAFAASSKTGATLGVVFSTAPTSGSLPYGTAYTVTGCGYDAANGGVTVVVNSPVAVSFAGQIPDANGCIAVTNFSTQGPGLYSLTAYQTIHRKSQAMAKTSFTLN